MAAAASRSLKRHFLRRLWFGVATIKNALRNRSISRNGGVWAWQRPEAVAEVCLGSACVCVCVCMMNVRSYKGF